uniref:NrsF family protein n=2 Tax=Amaricoccus TaxID=56999 RepID=UPI002601921A
ACPGRPVGGWAPALAAVPLILAAAAAAELRALPAPAWGPALSGGSSGQCLALVTLMGLPLLAGALWALSAGASERPALSGALAGLVAGGAAAGVYSLHCTEDSPLFYGVWYVLAILAVAAVGALAGARVLRW